jgi:hypothetical protein
MCGMRVRHGLAPRDTALVFAAAAASLLACATPGEPGPASAPPAPAAAQAESRLRPAPPPAELGSVERFAWQAVIQLGEAYAAGDVDGFLARVSRGFYRGYPALETALHALVRDTTSRSAVVAVQAVALEGERVSVRALWERRLVPRNGAPQFLAGETVFYFLRSETSLRLLDFRGDVPFGIQGIPAVP